MTWWRRVLVRIRRMFLGSEIEWEPDLEARSLEHRQRRLAETLRIREARIEALRQRARVVGRGAGDGDDEPS